MEGLRLLLTGASRGLGRALAMRFAERGVRLVLTARTEGGLAEVKDEIIKRGFPAPICVVLDLRKKEDKKEEGRREAAKTGGKVGGGEAEITAGVTGGVTAGVTGGVTIEGLGGMIAERMGGLEGVILNAAVLGELSPVAHSDAGMWRDVFAVNVFANRGLLESVHGLLAASRGFVVGVTCGDRRGEAYWGCYGASKAAMEAMLGSYGRECSRMGIEVCCWDPGRMSTGLRSGAYPGEVGDGYPIGEETMRGAVEIVERWVRERARG